MENKLTVKTEEQKCLAEGLIGNGVIYGQCSPEMQEVFRLALSQCQLMSWCTIELGRVMKIEANHIRELNHYLEKAYCMPDDIEIVVEPEPEPDDDIIAKLDAIISDAEDTNAFYELGEVIKELHERITVLETERKY